MITVEERKRFLATNERSTQASQCWSWRKKHHGEKRERKEKFVGAQINTASESTDDRKSWKDDSLLAGWSGNHHILNEDRQQGKRNRIHTRVSCYLGARQEATGGREEEGEEKKKNKNKWKKYKPKQKRAVNEGVCSLCLRAEYN